MLVSYTVSLVCSQVLQNCSVKEECLCLVAHICDYYLNIIIIIVVIVVIIAKNEKE